MISSLRPAPPIYLYEIAPNVLGVVREIMPQQEINRRKDEFYVCVHFERENEPQATYVTLKEWQWLTRGSLGDIYVRCNGTRHLVSSTKLDTLSFKNEQLGTWDDDESSSDSDQSPS